MATYVPGNGIAQVEARFSLNGQRVENTLYYDFKSSTFGDFITAIFDNYQTILWAQLRAICSVNISLQEIFVTDLTTQTSPTAVETSITNPLGVVNTDAVPNGTALVVCFRTNGRGRSSRGRNYIAGIAEGNKTASQFSVGAVVAVESAYAALQDEMGSLGFPQVVFSRFSNGQPRAVGLSQVVTAYDVVTPFTRSQRNRNPGVGV